MNRIIRRITVMCMLTGCQLLIGGAAWSAGLFGTESLKGDFVIAADGGFVAMTPFSANPLRLNVAMIGRLSYDGSGLAEGNWTISFHHPDVPFGVRSHFETKGTYYVGTDGHMLMEFEEFKIEPPAADDGIADGIVGIECYIVSQQQEARCVVNSLLSLAQGPDPVPEPVTMSGVLLRQH